MPSIIGGQVGTINISGGQFTAIPEFEPDVQRFLLENIAAKATHDANNTGFELPKCYPGTRKAVHRDVTEWVKNTEREHPIYWLYSPAGSGKTAIAKSLADSFSQPPKRHLLASFFFRRTSLHQNTEERFIATMAYQIKTNLPQTSRFIADAIKADPNIFQKDLRVQMDNLILLPLIEACKTASAPERATWPQLLLIDGLNECSGQDSQRRILDVVSYLVRHIRPNRDTDKIVEKGLKQKMKTLVILPFPLAVFLSSRPQAHIRGAFQGKELSRASLKICLPDTYSSGNDLWKFFVGRFQEVVDAHSHILQFPRDWPGRDVIGQFVDKHQQKEQTDI